MNYVLIPTSVLNLTSLQANIEIPFPIQELGLLKWIGQNVEGHFSGSHMSYNFSLSLIIVDDKLKTYIDILDLWITILFLNNELNAWVSPTRGIS